MKNSRTLRSSRPTSTSGARKSSARHSRRAMFETLEHRIVLAAPTFLPIANVTLNAGAPLMIALNGSDPDNANANLTFTASSSNSALTSTVMPSSNRDVKMIVQGYGEMNFQLFDNYVPGITNRISTLIQQGFYNHGTTASDPMTIHRLAMATKADGSVDTAAAPFAIQGGDPKGTGTGGSGINFDDAYNLDLRYTSPGILAMAKGSDPTTGFPNDTNDSQFFVMTKEMRQFDFNYAIFGFMTKGTSVLNAIRDAERTSATSDTPKNKIIISSVSEYTDTQNGVLMLKAPVGTTGTFNVTVTVNDGTESFQQIIQVTVQADTELAAPFLGTVADIYTTTGATTNITIPAVVAPGVTASYAALSNEAKLTANVAPSDGAGTITTTGGLVGVSSILVGVRTGSAGRWDTQEVPVFISPAAPTGITLVGGNATSFDNTAAKKLRFTVVGVTLGSDVGIYADGTLIGHATASGTSVTITTDGVTPLSEGNHTITARQSLNGQPYNVGNRTGFKDLVSSLSAPITIRVDKSTPRIVSTPEEEATLGQPYLYTPQTTAASGETITFSLVKGPAGMTINATTGVVRWTPQVNQMPRQNIVIRVADSAGNSSDQSFAVSIYSSSVHYNADPVVQLPGGTGANAVTIRRQGAALQVFNETTKRVIHTQPLTSVYSLTIQGVDSKADTLTVDFTNGAFTIPGSINFQAGGGASIDNLMIKGAGGANSFNLHAASIGLNGLKTAFSGAERIYLDGGAGNDTYLLADSAVPVSVMDSAGNDEVSFVGAKGAVTVDLSRNAGQTQTITPWRTTLAILGNIEMLVGSAYNDVLTGNALDNVIWGMGGNDRIHAGAGKNIVIGGAGADTIYGGAQADVLIGGTTSYDNQHRNMWNMLAQGNATSMFAMSTRNLTAGAVRPGAYTGGTVADDNAVNVLFGRGGVDWYMPGHLGRAGR